MISDDIQRVKLEACERSLEEFRLRCQELRAENELLHSDKEKQERDSLEIISYLRRDAERKDELIDSLKNTINQQREMFAQQREEERQESHEELAGARASAERMEADLQDSLASATDELNRLTEFKENKVKLEHDLQQGEQVRAPPPLQPALLRRGARGHPGRDAVLRPPRPDGHGYLYTDWQSDTVRLAVARTRTGLVARENISSADARARAAGPGGGLCGLCGPDLATGLVQNLRVTSSLGTGALSDASAGWQLPGPLPPRPQQWKGGGVQHCHWNRCHEKNESCHQRGAQSRRRSVRRSERRRWGRAVRPLRSCGSTVPPPPRTPPCPARP